MRRSLILMMFALIGVALTAVGATRTMYAQVALREAVLPGLQYRFYSMKPAEVAIKYATSASDRSSVVFKFNKRLEPRQEAPIFLLQQGQYVAIPPEEFRDENGRAWNLFYLVRGYELVIRARNGELPVGYVMIHISSGLTATSGARLSSPIDLLMTSDYVTPLRAVLTEKNSTDGAGNHPLLVKLWCEQGQRKVGFVKTDAADLLEKPDLQVVPLAHLEKGDTFEILPKDAPGYIKARVYLRGEISKRAPILVTEDRWEGLEELTAYKEGWLPTAAVEEIPPPWNEGIQVTVETIEGNQPTASKRLALVLNGLPWGSVRKELPGGQVSQEQVNSLEQQLLWEWAILPGQSYWATYLDERGSPISKFDPKAHRLVLRWTAEEYFGYKAARQAYLASLEDRWRGMKLGPIVAGHKEDIYDYFFRRRADLESLWIDWAYYNRLQSLDWFLNGLVELAGKNEEQRAAIYSGLKGVDRYSPLEVDESLARVLKQFLIPTWSAGVRERLDEPFRLPD